MINLLEELRRLNTHIVINTVESGKFARYGVLHKAKFPGLIETSLEAFPVSLPGDGYIRSLDALEIHPEAATLRNEILGQMDGEIGVCWGHNHYMNGLEWHNCTEVTIAASPLVVMLGDLRDMENGRLDSYKVEAFFVEAGQVIEIYSTTMHLAPCEVREGFNCLVILPRGTNYPLDAAAEKHDPALHSRNKWMVAHEENKKMIEYGSPPAIYGPNWEIRPLT
ncbi:MAG: DUF4867 family protein [Treponema sp.]|nr:DUF4867 family protein [Treponema sp.]